MKYLNLFLLVILFVHCQPKEKVAEVARTGDATLDKMSELLEDNPNNVDILFKRAQYLHQKGNYDQAIKDMAAAMRIDSTSAPFHHLLSDIYMDSYQSDYALKTMSRAAELHPKRPQTLLKYAETQLILKQYNGALKTINDLLAFDPQNAEGYFMLGLIFREMEDLDRSANSFQTAVEIDSELIDAWLMLGKIHEQKNDKRTLQFYENALTIDSLSLEALHSKAFYLQNHNQIDEAISIYKKINRIDKDYSAAYLNKGILYLEKNNLDKAWEEFNILCQRFPTYHLGFYYRGLVHEKQGKIQEAINDYQNSVNLKSDFSKGSEALARLKSKEQ